MAKQQLWQSSLSAALKLKSMPDRIMNVVVNFKRSAGTREVSIPGSAETEVSLKKFAEAQISVEGVAEAELSVEGAARIEIFVDKAVGGTMLIKLVGDRQVHVDGSGAPKPPLYLALSSKLKTLFNN